MFNVLYQFIDPAWKVLLFFCTMDSLIKWSIEQVPVFYKQVRFSLLYMCDVILCYSLRVIEEHGNVDLLKAQNRSLQDSVKEVERKHQVILCC